ncbi:hypothetical protein BJ546DRAFT_533456 [Cryomyces antarcticus]
MILLGTARSLFLYHITSFCVLLVSLKPSNNPWNLFKLLILQPVSVLSSNTAQQRRVGRLVCVENIIQVSLAWMLACFLRLTLRMCASPVPDLSHVTQFRRRRNALYLLCSCMALLAHNGPYLARCYRDVVIFLGGLSFFPEWLTNRRGEDD